MSRNSAAHGLVATLVEFILLTGHLVISVPISPKIFNSDNNLKEMEATLSAIATFNFSDPNLLPEQKENFKYLQMHFDLDSLTASVSKQIEVLLNRNNVSKKSNEKICVFVNDESVTDLRIVRTLKDLSALAKAAYAQISNVDDVLIRMNFTLPTSKTEQIPNEKIKQLFDAVLMGVIYKKLENRVNSIEKFVSGIRKANPSFNITLTYGNDISLQLVKGIFALKWQIRRKNFLRNHPSPADINRFYMENPPLFWEPTSKTQNNENRHQFFVTNLLSSDTISKEGTLPFALAENDNSSKEQISENTILKEQAMQFNPKITLFVLIIIGIGCLISIGIVIRRKDRKRKEGTIETEATVRVNLLAAKRTVRNIN